VEDPRYREMSYAITGKVGRFDHREGNDDYKQAGDLFRLMKPDEKRRLIQNLANHMRGIPERIIKLQISHFTKADPAYGRGVAEALAVAKTEGERAA
jgi:catalase